MKQPDLFNNSDDGVIVKHIVLTSFYKFNSSEIADIC